MIMPEARAVSGVMETAVAGVSAAKAAWREIPSDQLDDWNGRLRMCGAPLQQYPYWNEPHRRVYLQPRYVVWPNSEDPLGYACILTVGPPRARIGLVIRGPISLGARPLAAEAIEALQVWACAHGYILIRFTHPDSTLLDRLAAAHPSLRSDAFPFYPDAYDELFVQQKQDDVSMLAGFDREARRKLRRAGEARYEIRRFDDPQALYDLWPLFEGCSQRKGFRLYRSREAYCDMVRLAKSSHSAWVYGVYLDGRAVAGSLVCLDGRAAHCILAALDLGGLRGAASPAVLLHWHSMRELFRMGAGEYNFGGGPETVAFFKSQFSPQVRSFAAPVTWVLRPLTFAVWLKAVVPAVRRLSPVLKSAVARLHR